MLRRNAWRWLVGALMLALVTTAAAGCGGGKKKAAPAASTSTPAVSSSTTPATTPTGGKTFPVLKVSWLAPDQMDPGLSYTVAGWQVMWNVYLGLLSYKHSAGPDGATEIPALAQALPTITDGGKDFKFTLRSGVQYSDGTAVKASDFKCGIERLFKISSGGVGYFTPLIGAPDFAKTLKGHIAGIVADDSAGTVEFKLSQPNTEFESVLGLPFGAAVPCGTPDKDQSSTPIASTGPYMVTQYTANQGFTLKRNPHYTPIPGIPSGNPDEVQGTIVSDDAVALDNVINGSSDYDEHAIPADRLSATEQKYKDHLRLYVPASIYYLFMNHRVAPFDNKLVRQAVNYAIDRNAVVQIFGGLAKPTQNFLPPTYGSFQKIDAYTYDLAKAKSLIQQAGVTGMKVKIWGESDSLLSKNTVTYVADQLNKIGLKASPQLISRSTYFDTIGNQKTKAQIGWLDWFQDFPNPADFIDTLLNGSRITPVKNNNDGNVDVASVNTGIDQLVHKPAYTSADDSAWAALDKQIVVDDAGVAPLVNAIQTDFLSKRMDMSCYYNHVLFGWDFAAACVS